MRQLVILPFDSTSDEFRSFTVYCAGKNVRRSPGAVLVVCHFKAVALSRLVVVARFVFTLNLYHCKSSANAQSRWLHSITFLTSSTGGCKNIEPSIKNEKWPLTYFNSERFLPFLFIPGGIKTLSKLVGSRLRRLLRRKLLLCKAGHQFNVSAMSFWNRLCKYEKN